MSDSDNDFEPIILPPMPKNFMAQNLPRGTNAGGNGVVEVPTPNTTTANSEAPRAETAASASGNSVFLTVDTSRGGAASKGGSARSYSCRVSYTLLETVFLLREAVRAGIYKAKKGEKMTCYDEAAKELNINDHFPHKMTPHRVRDHFNCVVELYENFDEPFKSLDDKELNALETEVFYHLTEVSGDRRKTEEESDQQVRVVNDQHKEREKVAVQVKEMASKRKAAEAGMDDKGENKTSPKTPRRSPLFEESNAIVVLGKGMCDAEEEKNEISRSVLAVQQATFKADLHARQVERSDRREEQKRKDETRERERREDREDKREELQAQRDARREDRQMMCDLLRDVTKTVGEVIEKIVTRK